MPKPGIKDFTRQQNSHMFHVLQVDHWIALRGRLHYNLLDKKVRGPEVQPEGQIWRGLSLGRRVLAARGHEAGKWVPKAFGGRCSKAVGQEGAPRLARTVVDNIA